MLMLLYDQGEIWQCLGTRRAPGNCWQSLKEQLHNIHNPVLMLDTENIVNGKISWRCTDMTAFTVLIYALFFLFDPPVLERAFICILESVNQFVWPWTYAKVTAEATTNAWERKPTWVWHVEPRRVGHGVQVDVGPCREAVAIGLCWQDVEDGQEEADQPGTTHAEQSLRKRQAGWRSGSWRPPDLMLLGHYQSDWSDKTQEAWHFHASPHSTMETMLLYEMGSMLSQQPVNHFTPTSPAAAAQCFINQFYFVKPVCICASLIFLRCVDW